MGQVTAVVPCPELGGHQKTTSLEGSVLSVWSPRDSQEGVATRPSEVEAWSSREAETEWPGLGQEPGRGAATEAPREAQPRKEAALRMRAARVACRQNAGLPSPGQGCHRCPGRVFMSPSLWSGLGAFCTFLHSCPSLRPTLQLPHCLVPIPPSQRGSRRRSAAPAVRMTPMWTWRACGDGGAGSPAPLSLR